MILMKLLQILFLLGIVSLSPATAYICDDDTSSPSDAFEEHGCFCGTSRTTFHFRQLFFEYRDAFESCHEGVGSDNDFVDKTIECAFIQQEALWLNLSMNRTSLSEISVVPNGAQIYSDIRCL